MKGNPLKRPAPLATLPAMREGFLRRELREGLPRDYCLKSA